MGRLIGSLAATIVIFGVQALAAGTFKAYSAANADCAGACTPSFGSIQIRLCKEDSTGSGCGAVTDYIKLTPCCGAATAEWGEWGTWGTCTATCGACGRQERTRECTVTPAGCPVNCTGSETDQSTEPCDPANSDTTSYTMCLPPMPQCCPPYTRGVSTVLKRQVCMDV